MDTVRITYKKTFLSGHLQGLTVDAGFDIPDTIQDRRRTLLALLEMDKENPGKEALTNSLFYVSSIHI